MKTKLPRETQLVFAAASVSKAASAFPPVESIDATFDWDRVVEQARRHDLECTTYRALTGLSEGAVPAETLQALRSAYYGHASRHRALASEVVRVSELLERNGIRAAVLKGVVVAEAAYDDATLRIPGDIDLLVGRDDFARTRALLLDDGYEPHATPNGEEGPRDTGLGYELVSDNFCVEIHEELIPRSFGQFLDEPGMLERAGKRRVVGADLLVLAPADQFLFLCVHGAKHCWDTGRWIRDVAGLLVTGDEALWDEVLERARHLGCLRMVLLGVHLAERHFGATVPEQLHTAMAEDPRIAALSNDATRFMLSEAEVGELQRRGAFHLAVRERRRDRMRSFRHQFRLATMTSPRDKALVELPERARGLYPVVRALRLVGRAPDSIRHAVRLVRATLSR